MLLSFFLSFFFPGLSEGDLLSGVMFIHSSRTLGVSEVCFFVGGYCLFQQLK